MRLEKYPICCTVGVQIDKELQITPAFCLLESQTGVDSFLLFGLPNPVTEFNRKIREAQFVVSYLDFGGGMASWVALRCLWCFWGFILKGCPLSRGEME